jgi:hypothetical protein
MANPSQLDAGQVLPASFDEVNEALRVNVVVTTPGANSTSINDGTTPTTLATVLAASTGPSSLDTALVVSVSPNTNLNLPIGAASETTLAATETALIAFSNKTAGALVPAAFDYISQTYVGATTDISTVTYKTGGSGGTTVGTLTMAYDGSNRLVSITKT